MWYNNKGERFTEKIKQSVNGQKEVVMAKVIFNGVEFKSATAVKAQARADVMDVIVNALKAEYGDDNVAKVGSNEYGVIVGQVTDKDGFPQDVVTTLKPTVKEWEDRKTDKRVYEKYILSDVAKAYKMEVKEKEEKKEQERKAREAKKAKDKAEREKAKAEKSAE